MSPLFWPVLFAFGFALWTLGIILGYFLSRAASKKDPKPEDCNDD